MKGEQNPGRDTSEAAEILAGEPGVRLPVMPGFREMALRRMPDEQAALMAEDRTRLVRELAEQRQAAGVRASTLERYAAAVGRQITWKLNRPGEGASG